MRVQDAVQKAGVADADCPPAQAKLTKPAARNREYLGVGFTP